MGYEKLNKIEWMSPSVYLSLQKCFLNGIWVENKKPVQLPRTPEAILGIVVHRMYELASRGKIVSLTDFDEKWDEELASIEEKLCESSIEYRLVPVKNRVREYDVTKEACKLQVADHFKSKRKRLIKKETDSYKIFQEKQLIVPEKSVKGIIDLIIKKGDDIEIIDYKTRNIYEDSFGEKKVKDRIITQMTFYAGIYFYCNGKWPTKLSVMNNYGERINVQYSPADAIQIIDRAQCMKFSLNSIIADTSISESHKLNMLARPFPSTCKFCNYRPSCNAYKNKKISEANTDWPTDVFVVVDSIDTSKNGLTTITGSLIGNNRKVRIVNIPKEYIEDWWRPGIKISVFNVRSHPRSFDRYDLQQNSIITGFPLTKRSNRD
jgi:hypothetical protein